MPNGTYGGVRGRETKVIGGKLQESFVFLLLDFINQVFLSFYCISREETSSPNFCWSMLPSNIMKVHSSSDTASITKLFTISAVVRVTYAPCRLHPWLPLEARIRP